MVDPQLLFEKAQLQPGMHIADLGCGRLGHIVFPALKFVGETGLIYAVDILKDVLEDIKQGNGFCYIDPHGDAIDFIMSDIYSTRVIKFEETL